jgi:hypothetical protein
MGVIHDGTAELPNAGEYILEIDSEYDIVDITVSTTVPMTITGGPFNPTRGTAGVKTRRIVGVVTVTEGAIVDGEKTFNIVPLPLCKRKRNTFQLKAVNNSGGAGYVHFWVVNSSGNM